MRFVQFAQKWVVGVIFEYLEPTYLPLHHAKHRGRKVGCEPNLPQHGQRQVGWQTNLPVYRHYYLEAGRLAVYIQKKRRKRIASSSVSCGHDRLDSVSICPVFHDYLVDFLRRPVCGSVHLLHGSDKVPVVQTYDVPLKSVPLHFIVCQHLCSFLPVQPIAQLCRLDVVSVFSVDQGDGDRHTRHIILQTFSSACEMEHRRNG